MRVRCCSSTPASGARTRRGKPGSRVAAAAFANAISDNPIALRVCPSSFMRSNALGAQVMAECSRLVPVRSHVHVSTIEVYGELAARDQWFTKRSALNAKTPYSAAKAAGDQMVRAYMQTYPEMNIRMTHCANNYGPFQLPEKLIPLAVTNVLRGKKVPVYGDGLQSRDWLHVADYCARCTGCCTPSWIPSRPRPRPTRACCRSSTCPPGSRSPISTSPPW
ncbi:NAD-dependent epimerase/dehydratase family protein [Nocardia sp. NPDC004085]